MLRWPCHAIHPLHEGNGSTPQGQEGNLLGLAMEDVRSIACECTRVNTSRERYHFWLVCSLFESQKRGHDAINGTAGLLLEDDGSLAINGVVDQMLRQAPPLEFASYAIEGPT